MRTWNFKYLYDGPAVERNLRHFSDPELVDGDAGFVYESDEGTGQRRMYHFLYNASANLTLNITTQPFRVPCPSGGTWLQYSSPVSITDTDGMTMIRMRFHKDTPIETIILPADFEGTIIESEVKIVEPFASGSSIRIGFDSNKSLICGVDSIDPTLSGIFKTSGNIEINQAFPIKLFFEPANRLSGDAVLLVQFKPY